MVSDTYKTALQQAKVDLANAITQRDYWNTEIARLQQLVRSLAAASANPATIEAIEKTLIGQISLADIVQSVVNRSVFPISATNVRDAVIEAGYDLSGYANALALIHQTLKRLSAKGSISDQGDGTYQSSMLEAIKGLSAVRPPPGVKSKK